MKKHQETKELPSKEAMAEGRYWFRKEDLVEPLDWVYMATLPEKLKQGLELYMEGRVSIGRAAEIAGLSLREFDEVRAKARIPIRGPED